jgi:predicted transcriptional regulator
LIFPIVDAIYGSHMADLMKTTVYLEAADYRRLQALAQTEGRTAADLIREAVADYAQRRAGARRPRTIGMADSGLTDLAQRDEEYLEGFGEDS